MEHRARREPEPRLQAALQGGLLPGPAHGPLPGPALGDDPRARAGGHRDRDPAPRGRHRRPGRDRHALRQPAAHGRQAHALQVRREERGAARRARRPRSCPSRCSRTTARACTPTSRCGRAASRCSTSEAGYAGLSDMGRWYIGGLLTHAPAILAFSNPTTNSYKRLVPGYEAPVNLVYSQRNRSAAVRIPLYSQSPKAKRLEFRCPDPSCNPYLAFSAMLMAGLDGIQNRIEPPDPVDKDLYDLPPEELAKVPQVPGSLDAVLDGARGGPGVPQGGRRLHRRPHRDVGDVQARERGRRPAPAPAPVGVRPLLRPVGAARRRARRSAEAGEQTLEGRARRGPAGR